MSNEKRGFQGGIRVKPNAEGVAKEGDINVDENSKIKARLENSEKEVITSDQVQTLENKTINGTSSGNNTVTIDASNAVYDPTGNTQISGTNVQEALDSVDVATQTNATGLSDHINSETIVHAAVAISFDRTNIINNTELDPAFTADEVQGIIDEIAVVLDDGETRLDSLETLSGVAQYSTDLGTFTGTTIAQALEDTSIKSALQVLVTEAEANAQAISGDAQALVSHTNATTVHGVEGEVVGTLNSQTLQSKEFSIQQNTLRGFAANSFMLTDGSGAAKTFSPKPIPTGDVVGTDDSQVLTNKTIQGASIEDPVRLDAKKDTFINLQSYATTATDGQFVFATDTKEYYVIKNQTLSKPGSESISDLSIAAKWDTSSVGQYNFFSSSARSFSISQGTLNCSHIAGSSDLTLTVEDIPSKFLDKDLELSFSFRSSYGSELAPLYLTFNDDPQKNFAITNSNQLNFFPTSGWEKPLPNLRTTEYVLDVGKIFQQNVNILLNPTPDFNNYFSNLPKVYEPINSSSHPNTIPAGTKTYDVYSSSFYNKTFLGADFGYLVVDDQGVIAESGFPFQSGNNISDRVYYSGGLTASYVSALTIDESNGTAYFGSGSSVVVVEDPVVDSSSLVTFATISGGFVAGHTVSSICAHNDYVLIGADNGLGGGSFYVYRKDAFGMLSQFSKTSFGVVNDITRDPITGIFYLAVGGPGSDRGFYYIDPSSGNWDPVGVGTYEPSPPSVNSITAYDDKIWVARDGDIIVISGEDARTPGNGGNFTSSASNIGASHVRFDVRTNNVFAAWDQGVLACLDYHVDTGWTILKSGVFINKIGTYPLISDSLDTATSSQSDKIHYISEGFTIGTNVVHGFPISQISDIVLRIKDANKTNEVVFYQNAGVFGGSVSGVQTMLPSTGLAREINSMSGQSDYMRLDSNRIYLKQGLYKFEVNAQVYGGVVVGSIHTDDPAYGGQFDFLLSESVAEVGTTPITDWINGSLYIQVISAEQWFEIRNINHSSASTSAKTGFVPEGRGDLTRRIMAVKVTKL